MKTTNKNEIPIELENKLIKTNKIKNIYLTHTIKNTLILSEKVTLKPTATVIIHARSQARHSLVWNS